MGEIERLLCDPIFGRLGLALLHSLWQGLALALAAWLLRSALRRAAPAKRYLAFLSLFAAMAAAPVLTFILWTQAPPPAVMTQERTERLLAAAQQRGLAATAEADGQASGARIPTGIPSCDWARAAWWRVRASLPAAGALWAAGVLVLCLQLLVQWAAFAHVVRRGSHLDGEWWRWRLRALAARLGVRRAVEVRQVARIGAPGAAGWLRPVILLPPAVVLGLTPEQLEAVLAHELAHIRRHDYLANVFQRVVEIVLFYHPAVWWLSGLIQIERESCCDDLAVTACGGPVSYAGVLARLEDLRAQVPAPALAMTRGPMLMRVRRLVVPVQAGRRPLSWSTVLFPAIALLAIALTSGLVPVGGEPYIPGTLIYQEPVEPVGSDLWGEYRTTVRAISGRSRWVAQEPTPLSRAVYSPQGDAVLLPQPDFSVGARATSTNRIWKAKVDTAGRPDLSHFEDLAVSIAGGKGYFGAPQWSPDGSRMLFVHTPPVSVPGHWEDVFRLYVMNADGSGAREVSVPGRVVGGGQWTPDGTRLLLSTSVLSAGGVIPCRHDCRTLLVDMDGRPLRDLRLSSAVMSPDGRSIVGIRVDPVHGVRPARSEKGWYHPTTGAYHWELVVARPDTGEERVLLSRSYPNAELPEDPCSTALALLPSDLTWSPDSRQIAFLGAMNWLGKEPAEEQVELHIYDIPSGRLTQVTRDGLPKRQLMWVE